jgi:cell division protein FtsB
VTAGGTAGPAGFRSVLAARPKFTSRAAVLAIVLCAIALILAYPVREYMAEQRQIAQLRAGNELMAVKVQQLRTEQRQLASPRYIEQAARDDLHMCFPWQTCYEIIYPGRPHASTAARPAVTPWYGKLWASVRKADQPASG